MKIMVYEARPDERADLEKQAALHGVELSVTDAVPTLENASLAAGCIGVSILGQGCIDAALLDAYHALGIRYLSTRTIGYDHIDLDHARSIGLRVCSASYAPQRRGRLHRHDDPHVPAALQAGSVAGAGQRLLSHRPPGPRDEGSDHRHHRHRPDRRPGCPKSPASAAGFWPMTCGAIRQWNPRSPMWTSTPCWPSRMSSPSTCLCWTPTATSSTGSPSPKCGTAW